MTSSFGNFKIRGKRTSQISVRSFVENFIKIHPSVWAVALSHTHTYIHTYIHTHIHTPSVPSQHIQSNWLNITRTTSCLWLFTVVHGRSQSFTVDRGRTWSFMIVHGCWQSLMVKGKKILRTTSRSQPFVVDCGWSRSFTTVHDRLRLITVVHGRSR